MHTFVTLAVSATLASGHQTVEMTTDGLQAPESVIRIEFRSELQDTINHAIWPFNTIVLSNASSRGSASFGQGNGNGNGNTGSNNGNNNTGNNNGNNNSGNNNGNQNSGNDNGNQNSGNDNGNNNATNGNGNNNSTDGNGNSSTSNAPTGREAGSAAIDGQGEGDSASIRQNSSGGKSSDLGRKVTSDKPKRTTRTCRRWTFLGMALNNCRN